jgi:hypothetical protein
MDWFSWRHVCVQTEYSMGTNTHGLWRVFMTERGEINSYLKKKKNAVIKHSNMALNSEGIENPAH